MFNMQKQILIVITSLALFSGCGGKSKEVATSEASSAAAATSNAATPRQEAGEKTYKGTCSICHKSGLNGAPRLDSRQDWEARIAQGNDILYDHAINGYRGSKGFMPPRGSNIKLSEGEVKEAVDYMVAHAMQTGN